MKKSMFTNLIEGAMNGATKMFRKHPVISYLLTIGPACVLLACGYVAIQEGFYYTPDGKED